MQVIVGTNGMALNMEGIHKRPIETKENPLRVYPSAIPLLT